MKFVSFGKVLLLMFMLLAFFCAQGQYYDQGQSPPGLKWLEIKSPRFRVIFPKGSEQQAQRLTALLEHSADLLTQSLHSKPRPINVVLHTYSSYSNAMVVWAPKRMELYSFAPQDVYAQDWLSQIALHEYRHVVQLEALNTGFTRVLSFIFGQQATAGVLGLFIPLWMLEGDAVASETAFSHSGRGRVPVFTREMDAQLLDKGVYSYNKATFESYSSFVPDRYKMGYLMVAKVRELYGDTVFKHAFNRVGSMPFTIMPLTQSMRKTSGKGKAGLYREVMKKHLDSLRSARAGEEYTAAFIHCQNTSSTFTSYQNAFMLADGSLIALKTGMGATPTFVRINAEGKEERLILPGYLQDDRISQHGEWLVWSERIPGLRWANRSYSRIHGLNLYNGEKIHFGSKMRLLSPALNHAATRIAVLENKVDYSQELHIMSFPAGEILRSFVQAPGARLLTPSWAPSGDSLLAILLTAEGKALVSVSATDGSICQLSPFTYAEINNPLFYEGGILFSASFSGRDELYRFWPEEQRLVRLTSSPYSATFPSLSPDGQRIVYTNYTADGQQILSVYTDSIFHAPANFSGKTPASLADRLSEQEGQQQLSEAPDTTYPVKRYNRLLHAVNIHSWGLLSTTDIQERPGFIMSQNMLSNTFFKAGYDYSREARQGVYFAELTYKGLFPVLDFFIDKAYFTDSYTDGILLTEPISYRFTKQVMQLKVSTPMNLSRGSLVSGITPQLGMSRYTLRHEQGLPKRFKDVTDYLSYARLYAYAVRRTAAKDLQPRYGIIANSYFRHSLFNPERVRNSFSAELYGFLPGIGNHHGLMVYAGLLGGNYQYTLSFPIRHPRGYQDLLLARHLSLSAEYVLPLLYPDLNLGQLAYVKRVRCRLFADWIPRSFFNMYFDRSFFSLGAEITADTHLFRFLSPIEIGLQWAYRPDIKQAYPGLIIRVDLYNF